MRSALGVWWDCKIVGSLLIDEHGDLEFAYDAAWLSDTNARPISRSLPLREEPFDRRETRPFFAGLLPEAAVRENIARALGLSKTNDFALLKALGGDVAGAITLWPDGETPPSYDGAVTTDALDDDALVELIDSLPHRPLMAGKEGVRLSLAGAQNKLPVVLIDGRIALPASGQPTTHILKPPIRDYDHTTENEAFVMQLAAAVGLDVAAAVPTRVKDRTFLLVTRYDRVIDDNNRAHRLHQEDFCQALGINPEHKYAAEQGPTFKTSFELLREAASRPAVEALKLVDAAIFNLIAGNADAHGKNFSLLYRQGVTTLAPLYDLMCTAAYPQVSPVLAMKMAQTSDIKDFTPRTWEKFAADIELGAPFLRRRIQEIAQTTLDNTAAVAATIAGHGFNTTALEQFQAIVSTRAKAIAASV